MSKLFRNVPIITHERMSPSVVVILVMGFARLVARDAGRPERSGGRPESRTPSRAARPWALISAPKLPPHSHPQPPPWMVQRRWFDRGLRFAGTALPGAAALTPLRAEAATSAPCPDTPTAPARCAGSARSPSAAPGSTPRVAGPIDTACLRTATVQSPCTTRSSSQLNTSFRFPGTARCTSTGLAAARANCRLNARRYFPSRNRLRTCHVIDSGQPQLFDQPVLQHAIHPLHPPFGLRTVGQDQFHPQLLHRPPKLRLRRFPGQLLGNARPRLRTDRCCPDPHTGCPAAHAGAPSLPAHRSWPAWSPRRRSAPASGWSRRPPSPSTRTAGRALRTSRGASRPVAPSPRNTACAPAIAGAFASGAAPVCVPSASRHRRNVS